MIRTIPNLILQNVKHEKHSENPSRNRTCIDSNISLNFGPNKQQNKYKLSMITVTVHRLLKSSVEIILVN